MLEIVTSFLRKYWKFLNYYFWEIQCLTCKNKKQIKNIVLRNLKVLKKLPYKNVNPKSVTLKLETKLGSEINSE